MKQKQISPITMRSRDIKKNETVVGKIRLLSDEANSCWLKLQSEIENLKSEELTTAELGEVLFLVGRVSGCADMVRVSAERASGTMIESLESLAAETQRVFPDIDKIHKEKLEHMPMVEQDVSPKPEFVSGPEIVHEPDSS
jgi:hypothetical protein